MIRLAVVAEGQTEEEFVKQMLDPQLQQFGVPATPVLLDRARNRSAGGGHVTVPKLVLEVAHLSKSFDAVTTLIDFYGFKGKEQRSVDELESVIRKGVEEKTGWLGKRLVPYVQRHEFEGLLFSDVSAFKILPGVPPATVQSLKDIRFAFETPEDINDNRTTAPSKRIAAAVPRYRKPVHGPLIAEKAGLERIRTECPRFNAWLESLEILQDRIGQ